MLIGKNREKYFENLKLFGITERCKNCNSYIWYPSTLAKISSNQIKFINTNHLTTKKVGDSVYSLSVCYSCLILKFPEAKNKNSSKLFNTCNEYVKYAFLVSDSDFIKQKKKCGVTLKSMILKYGEEIGKNKWNEYANRQRITNTFEYKSMKYGMSENDFKEFNRSRAITLPNLCKKYGESEGSIKWKEYVDRQKYTKKIDYYVEKYGEVEGPKKYSEVNSKKSLSLDNYIKKFGYEIGSLKFKENITNKKSKASIVSQSFFKELDDQLSPFKYTTYYETKNREFGKILSSLNRYCKLDFYIKELKINIEYFGDYWHANPRIYSEKDIIHSGMTAGEIWEKDKIRISELYSEHNIKTIIVWQKDDYLNRSIIINKLINEIKEQI